MRSWSCTGACGEFLRVVAGKVVHCETLARTVAYLTSCSGESFAGGRGFTPLAGFVMGVLRGPLVGSLNSSSSSVTLAELAGVSEGGTWEDVDLKDEPED